MRVARLICAVGVIAMVTAVVVQECQAQRRGGGRGMGFGGGARGLSQLVVIEVVQKDLGLTDEEIEKLAGVVEDLGEERQGLMQDVMSEFGNFQDLSDDERAEMQGKMREALAKFAATEQQALGEVLDDKQVSRLKQIALQEQGVAALSNPEVAEKLGLSADQKSEIQEINTAAQEKLQQAMQEARESGDFQSIREAMTESRAATEKEVMGVLTDDQRKEFDEMKGEKINLPQPQRGNRRGGADF